MVTMLPNSIASLHSSNERDDLLKTNSDSLYHILRLILLHLTVQTSYRLISQSSSINTLMSYENIIQMLDEVSFLTVSPMMSTKLGDKVNINPTLHMSLVSSLVTSLHSEFKVFLGSVQMGVLNPMIQMYFSQFPLRKNQQISFL